MRLSRESNQAGRRFHCISNTGLYLFVIDDADRNSFHNRGCFRHLDMFLYHFGSLNFLRSRVTPFT